MAKESKPPEAMAAAAVAQAETEVRCAVASAPLVGSRSLSTEPAEEAVVSSADLVRWSGQVEGEVQSPKGGLHGVSPTVGEFSVHVSSLRDAVAACASQ